MGLPDVVIHQGFVHPVLEHQCSFYLDLERPLGVLDMYIQLDIEPNLIEKRI